MAKMCWKCHAFHEESERVCPYCGASFAKAGSEYHDGFHNTRVWEDEIPPIKVPKSDSKCLASYSLIMFAVVGIFAVLAAVNMVGLIQADVAYDYAIEDKVVDGEYVILTYGVALVNDSEEFIDWSDLDLELLSRGQIFEASAVELEGDSGSYSGKVSFVIPDLYYTDNCRIMLENDVGLLLKKTDLLA